MNILVLCTGNSCRSQMLHGYLKTLAPEEWTIYSAGVETHGVNPIAIEVMREARIDISDHTSDLVDDFKDVPFKYMITVCDHAKETCPYVPSDAELIHHSFDDPAKAQGTDAEVMDAFRKVRNEIGEFAEEFVATKLL